MAIRIARSPDADRTILRIDGHLKSEDVAELRKECAAANGSIVLELSDLGSADAAGAEVLRELATLGTKIRGASRYIELLLGKES